MTKRKSYRRDTIRKRIRKIVTGSSDYPRLSVFRSNKDIYCQIIDDTEGKTLVSLSSIDKEILDLKARLNEIYQTHTGKPLKEIEKALERDNFMKPNDAMDFGLIDHVVDKREIKDK